MFVHTHTYTQRYSGHRLLLWVTYRLPTACCLRLNLARLDPLIIDFVAGDCASCTHTHTQSHSDSVNIFISIRLCSFFSACCLLKFQYLHCLRILLLFLFYFASLFVIRFLFSFCMQALKAADKKGKTPNYLHTHIRTYLNVYTPIW